MNGALLSWRPANIATIALMVVAISFVGALVMQGYRQFSNTQPQG